MPPTWLDQIRDALCVIFQKLLGDCDGLWATGDQDGVDTIEAHYEANGLPTFTPQEEADFRDDCDEVEDLLDHPSSSYPAALTLQVADLLDEMRSEL